MKKEYDKTLKNIPTVSENWVTIDWKCTKQQPEIKQNLYTQVFPNFTAEEAELEIVAKATYGLHSNEYFEISKVTF